MKKKSPKLVATFVVVLTLTNVFSLTGCGKTENVDSQTNQEVQLDITEDEIPAVQMDENAAQAQWDEETRAERAELEAKVKAAGGISEEEAVEIAKKAMETDLGDKAKELKLGIDETFGWSSDLCVADWSEIKEKDKGALAYSVGFNNVEDVPQIDDWLNYVCVVNAVDGSILEAYTIQGLGDNTVYYEY